MNKMFPETIEIIVKGLVMNEIVDCHRSGDLVYAFGNQYILKVSDDVLRLQSEYEKDLWISQYISSPKPIKFLCDNNKAYYLREYLNGNILCSSEYLNNPLLLIDLLVDAITILHNTKVNDKKYILDKEYNTLTHGDFCLPNILAIDNKIVGFIDLGDSGIGDPWRDYAWSIWSLEYNLKTKDYTPLLLKKLNISFDEEKYKKYIN